MTVEKGSITSHVTVPSDIESPTSAESKFAIFAVFVVPACVHFKVIPLQDTTSPTLISVISL